MAWVVKFEDGTYSDGEGGKVVSIHAERAVWRFRKQAYDDAARWDDSVGARIVRLKPRAKLDEAAIRRAERERIAAAVDEQGILITIAHRPVGQIAYLDNCTNGARGAQALKSAILAFDWKPGAP